MAMPIEIHCFCQKPLTRTIYEARKMAQVAKETGVCTQMGNQGYCGEAIRDMSMEGRLTLCNMTIEAGSRVGMVAPDD